MAEKLFEKNYIDYRCPKCKEEKVIFKKLLDANPPQYRYECEKCGWVKIQELEDRTLNYKHTIVSIVIC